MIIPLLLASLSLQADTTLFCKCDCPPNGTILMVPLCNECTKNFCYDNEACTKINNTNAVIVPWEPVCFRIIVINKIIERGSFKDEFIVTVYIVVTLSLIFYALTMQFSKRFGELRMSIMFDQVPNRDRSSISGDPGHESLLRNNYNDASLVHKNKQNSPRNPFTDPAPET